MPVEYMTEQRFTNMIGAAIDLLIAESGVGPSAVCRALGIVSKGNRPNITLLQKYREGRHEMGGHLVFAFAEFFGVDPNDLAYGVTCNLLRAAKTFRIDSIEKRKKAKALKTPA